jgi:Zn-dependent protease
METHDAQTPKIAHSLVVHTTEPLLVFLAVPQRLDQLNELRIDLKLIILMPLLITWLKNNSIDNHCLTHIKFGEKGKAISLTAKAIG